MRPLCSEKGRIRDGFSAPTEISQHCQHARWERGGVPFRYSHDYHSRSIIDIESLFSDGDFRQGWKPCQGGREKRSSLIIDCLSGPAWSAKCEAQPQPRGGRQHQLHCSQWAAPSHALPHHSQLFLRQAGIDQGSPVPGGAPRATG
jgi:hypothetical protein